LFVAQYNNILFRGALSSSEYIFLMSEKDIFIIKRDLESKLNTIAWNAYMATGGVKFGDTNYSPWMNNILKQVSKDQSVQRLLWETAEDSRLLLVEKQHSKVCEDWMKNSHAPEYIAWHALVKHNRKLEKFIDMTLSKTLSCIEHCCGENGEDELTDLNENDQTLYERKCDLDDEFHVRGVHDKIDLCDRSMKDALRVSTKAAEDAKFILNAKNYQLIRCSKWRKQMGLSRGKKYSYPLPEDVLLKQLKEHLPAEPLEMN